ncbi:unnamed protein product [Alternaria alternata]
MQRDDRVPLKEIYDTPEALHEQVERIIDLALYEESYDTPLRLRYVTPVSREQWLANDNYNEYRLTPLDEHQHDMDYVTDAKYQHYELSELTDDIHENYTTSWDRATSQYGCNSIFRAVQDCENLVVADRIAIFGHVCDFQYRLVSNILHSVRFSFSACVIALLLANVHVDRGRRFELVKSAWKIFEEHSKIGKAKTSLETWILILLSISHRFS